MTPVWAMVGASVASWLMVALVAGLELEVLLGMIAPLVVAAGTLVMAQRTYRRDPSRMTAMMTMAFAAKMVFFGVYVGLIVMLVPLRVVPFVISFTSYYIALHLTEAFCLRRLFAQGARASG